LVFIPRLLIDGGVGVDVVVNGEEEEGELVELVGDGE
jgi:hypothetical protein